jgi:hypothetical protein
LERLKEEKVKSKKQKAKSKKQKAKSECKQFLVLYSQRNKPLNYITAPTCQGTNSF